MTLSCCWIVVELSPHLSKHILIRNIHPTYNGRKIIPKRKKRGDCPPWPNVHPNSREREGEGEGPRMEKWRDEETDHRRR